MTEMRLDEVENYNQLKEILESSSWQKFERIVGKIFEFHDYEVKINQVYTFKDTKRQYDVIAGREDCIAVDCKKWDNKRRIKYGLEKAVDDQVERVKKLPWRGDKYPVLVLSCQSPIEYHNSVPIVSVYKFNEFLSNFQAHKREILSV